MTMNRDGDDDGDGSRSSSVQNLHFHVVTPRLIGLLLVLRGVIASTSDRNRRCLVSSGHGFLGRGIPIANSLFIMLIRTLEMDPVPTTWGKPGKGRRRFRYGAIRPRERIESRTMIGTLKSSIVLSESLSSTHRARLIFAVDARFDPFDLPNGHAHAIVRRTPIARSDPTSCRGDVSDETRQDDESDMHIPVWRDVYRPGVWRGRQDHGRGWRFGRRRSQRGRPGRG